MDGETVPDVESRGVDGWLGALAGDLKAGTYRPQAVRQVLIPKKQRGKFRPLGIPCLRDRVAQTAAMLVLSPIFEADLEPEQYAYRPGRGAHDACRGRDGDRRGDARGGGAPGKLAEGWPVKARRKEGVTNHLYPESCAGSL